MLDEIKTIEVEYKGEKVVLIPSFESFKKLHKITNNAFKVMEEFVSDPQKRVEYLPVLIQSMADKELSIAEIESNILGMKWTNVIAMSSVIFELINSEYLDPLSIEENSKNVEIPSPKENQQN